MSKSLREAYGEALTALGRENQQIVVFDADLSHATQTCIFSREFPGRFYNMGIAEADAVCAAAAFANTGLIPFFSTFAIFGAGRAFEQIRNSIAYVNANVKLVFTHAGISVGEDGGSHQAIEDISLMRGLPNMTVIVPCDPLETGKAVCEAARIDGPVYIRVGRPVCENITALKTPFELGKAVVLKDGTDLCLIACGLEVHEALKSARVLEDWGISTAVVDMHTIKPIDSEVILHYGSVCKAVVTVEEHSVIGGLGSAVAEVLCGNGNARFARIGIQDKFGRSGKPSDLFEAYGLSADKIVQTCRNLIK